MEGDRRLSLTVGGLALVSLVALGVTIFSLSAQQGVWRSRYRLISYFENVQGLIASAPVWLAGKPVGRVESVTFGDPEPGRPPVKVVLQIDDAVRDRIRSDSVATIDTIGLLGDRYIEISPGTRQGVVLPAGGELPSQSPPTLGDMLARANEVMATLDGFSEVASNVSQLTRNLDEAVTDFREARGVAEIADLVKGIREIVVEIQEGKGVLHDLVYEEYEGTGLQSIESSLASLDSLLQEVRHGKGILHTLIYEEPTEQDIVLKFVEAGSHLNSILQKLDRGEGTLGLMVNDPTLYEDLKLLVGGANRSAVVRTMIRLSTDGEQ